jgi:hypothetical protein
MHDLPPCFVTIATRLMSLVEQELPTLPYHLSSHPVFSGVRDVQSLIFCVVFCGSLYVLLSLFFWSLCYLSVFVLRFLITPLVSSTFSCSSSCYSLICLFQEQRQTIFTERYRALVLGFWVMMFITTFNNISVTSISWRSVLLVGETGVPGENHSLAASHWQTLSHNVVSSTPRLNGIRTHNVTDDRHWLPYDHDHDGPI